MIKMSNNPIVTITMENNDEMKIELYPEVAQNTVNNFISLVENKFYDGLIFHRVIEGFMLQAGCPDGNGMGGPGYSIKGEFSGNGVKNDLIHERGVLSMARSQMNNSAGSQFFVMHKDSPHLDGQYAAFGKVIEGLEIVDKIASVATDRNDRPKNDKIMSKVIVELNGYEPEELEKM
jgi:peptidyl-prolyl cis-trans isomerase B (cyclophilin B)